MDPDRLCAEQKHNYQGSERKTQSSLDSSPRLQICEKKLSRSLLFVNVLLIKSTPATVRKWNHIQELPFPPLKVCWFERRRANSGPWSGGRSTRVSLWASRPRAPPRRGRPLDQRAPDTSAQASFPRVNGEGHRGPQC